MNIIQKWTFPLKLIFFIFCILSAVFIAYHDALNNNFLSTWDTQGYVIDNIHIRTFTLENIWWMLTNVDMVNWHPLTWVSHALDYALFELDPWGHHFTNILIHSFNSVLLFILVIVLMSFKTKLINNQILLAAGVSAILFGIHPQHVESVVWISERKDVLCLFFILLTLISYVFYVEKANRSRYFLTVCCFVLALLSKPMAVTVPIILLLMDVYPLNRTRLTASTQTVSYKKLFIEKIPFFILTSFSIIFTLIAQQTALHSIESLGIVYRILNAFNTLFFYITKFIFPVSLSPFYTFQTPSTTLEYYAILLPIIAAVLTTFLCVYLWFQKKYYWLIAWIFYLVTLSPVIGIIQVGAQAAADRYVYLPTIPFYMLLGIGFSRLLYTESIKKYIKYGSIVGILFITFSLIRLTQEQGKIWKNDLIFWVYAAAYTPESALLQYRVGNIYFKMGGYEEALIHYQRAIALAPSMTGWYPSVLKMYLVLNQLDKALAFIKPPMRYNIDLGFTMEELYYIEGWIYQKQGLLEKARKVLLQALTIEPKFKKAQDLLLKINDSHTSEERIPIFPYQNENTQ